MQQQQLTTQQIIDHIKPRILSVEHQSERVRNLISIPLAGDLVLCWYADVTDLVLPGQGTSAYLPITADLAEALDLSPDDLLRLGQEHSKGTYKLQSMQDAMGALLGLPDEIGSSQDSIPMYILCSKSLQYGAAAILDNMIQSQLAAVCPEGYYLIGSSVHEMLAVPKSTANPANLVSIVREINSNADIVQPHDVLSNYIYTITEGRLVVAA